VAPENPEHPPDWNALIQKSKDGDDAAACRLVEHLHGHVLRIVRNHLPRSADEKDLLQEIFMKTFANIHRYRGDQPFVNWVAKIALNTCYDHLRKQKSRPELRFADLTSQDAEFVDALLSRTTEESPADSRRDGRELVEKLLGTLNARERMILEMIDLEKRSVREVCELTGWGESKIKVTAMRARKKLNNNLTQLEEESRQ
jgi:RNA polymerase sigma-70 factor (ECF subfamily)